jgi:hypothetical protein
MDPITFRLDGVGYVSGAANKNGSEPIVLSMSALKTYLRCRRSFYYLYERGLEPIGGTSEAMQLGTDLHAILETAAIAQMNPDKSIKIEDQFRTSPMLQVAGAYLHHNPLPERIVGAERSHYVKLIDYPVPVWLRCTYDLEYIDESGVYMWRDYKSFERAPTRDHDLNFQARLYSAALQRSPLAQGPQRVQGEMVYIRRVTPGTSNSKGVWKVEECYMTDPLVYSEYELRELWHEAQEAAKEIVRASETIDGRAWFRSPLEVGPHSCNSMACKQVCVADLQEAGLSGQTVEMLATQKLYTFIELPSGEKAVAEVERNRHTSLLAEAQVRL